MDMQNMQMTVIGIGALIKQVDYLEELMAITMTVLDEWAITHNVSTEELEDTMEKSVSIMKGCHESMGW